MDTIPDFLSAVEMTGFIIDMQSFSESEEVGNGYLSCGDIVDCRAVHDSSWEAVLV